MDRFAGGLDELVFDEEVDESARWDAESNFGLEEEDEGKGYDPSQPRDDHGRWSSTGGSGSTASESFDLGTYPAASTITESVAKQRFEHLKTEYDRHYKEYHREQDAARKATDYATQQQHYKNAREAFDRSRVAAYDAMTYRQVGDAVDKDGYLRARQEAAHKYREHEEAKERVIERMVADGVRSKGKEYYEQEIEPHDVSKASYKWDATPDEHFAAAQEKYDNLTREHFDMATAVHREGLESLYDDDYKQPYYGEPDNVKMKPAELGAVSDALPASVAQGGGSEDLKQYMANAKVAIQVKDTPLDRLISNERFKNRFEGGVHGVGKGNRGYNDARKAGEEELFGIPKDADGSARPNYGYLEHPDRLSSTGGDIGMSYGTNQIVLRDDVKARTTFTVGDSLDDRRHYNSRPAAVNNPQVQAAIDDKDPVVSVGRYTDDWKVEVGDRRATPRYIEAQVFGQIKLSDIEEIRIPKSRALKPAQEKKLASAGVRVVRVAPTARNFFASIIKPWDDALNDDED